jgi:hypothetical protein
LANRYDCAVFRAPQDDSIAGMEETVMLGSVRAEDRIPGDASPRAEPLDPRPLLGTWHATDENAGGVLRLELFESQDGLMVRAFGATEPEPYDWGEVRATVYGKSVVATEVMAFSALYDFGFMTTLLAAYGKQGILVLDTFNTFTDGSGRANYFSREFFHR